MTVSLKCRFELLVRSVFNGLILAYQWGLSPVLGPRCRYWPSCSQYCLEALQMHGARKGLRLGVLRLLRCHPWGSSGFDPVPICATCVSNERSRQFPKPKIFD